MYVHTYVRNLTSENVKYISLFILQIQVSLANALSLTLFLLSLTIG